MLRRNLLLIGIAVLLIGAGVGLLAFFSNQPKITLSATEVPDTLTINGKSIEFKENMQIDYNRPLEIRATKQGYQDFTKTLDPKIDKASSLTMVLAPKPDPLADIPTPTFDPLPNNVGPLLQAAKNNNTSLLDFGDALNVDILESKYFEGDNYVAYRVKKKPPVTTDEAFLIVQNSPDGYVVALGPGTSFGAAEEYIDVLPDEVIQYMKEKQYVQ